MIPQTFSKSPHKQIRRITKAMIYGGEVILVEAGREDLGYHSHYVSHSKTGAEPVASHNLVTSTKWAWYKRNVTVLSVEEVTL